MEWRGPEGTAWVTEEPRALAVVELTAHLLPKLGEGGEAWRDLARWLTTLTVEVEGVEVDGAEVRWEALSRGERLRLVESLSIERLDDWASAVLLSCSLTTELLTQVKQLARVVAGGGCECRRCKASDARGPIAACLYTGVSLEAERRVQSWWQLRDADLSGAPWWCWQLKDAWELGRAEAVSKARKNAARRKQIDEDLKRRGRR